MKSVDDWAVEDPISDLLKDVPMAGGSLEGVNLQLRKAEIKIQQEQIRVARCSNNLNKSLFASNESASKQSEVNAKLMNSATEQLAKSTAS